MEKCEFLSSNPLCTFDITFNICGRFEIAALFAAFSTLCVLSFSVGWQWLALEDSMWWMPGSFHFCPFGMSEEAWLNLGEDERPCGVTGSEQPAPQIAWGMCCRSDPRQDQQNCPAKSDPTLTHRTSSSLFTHRLPRTWGWQLCSTYIICFQLQHLNTPLQSLLIWQFPWFSGLKLTWTLLCGHTPACQLPL